MIDFGKVKTTKVDAKTITYIVSRASRLRPTVDTGCLEMDLFYWHHKEPLRLNELLDASDFNFAHDVFGIHECLDRETGEMKKSFVPRFTKGVK